MRLTTVTFAALSVALLATAATTVVTASAGAARGPANLPAVRKSSRAS
jgi:hypothetical protein